MKKFVKIVNSLNVAVTVNRGLSYIDTTNFKSPVKDRMAVKPTWTKLRVKIEPGVHWYPAEVADWDDVKALTSNGTLTVAEKSDGENLSAEELETATKLLTALNKNLDKVNKQVEKNQEIKKKDEAVRAEI